MSKHFVPIFCSAVFVVALLSACESHKSQNFPSDAYVDVDPEVSQTNVPTPINDQTVGIVVPRTEIPIVKNEPEKQVIEIVDVKSDTAPTTTSAKDGGVTYKVQKNDSLWSIGMTYGVSTDALAKANNIDKNKPLKIGQILVIPDAKNAVNKPIPTKTTTTAKSSATTKTTTKSSATTKTTTVKPASNIQPKEGEQLYVVKAGDSLSVIAARYHVKTNDLAKANNLSDKNTIRVGQTLLIPASKTATGSAASNVSATAKTTDTKTAATTAKPSDTKNTAVKANEPKNDISVKTATDIKSPAEPAKTEPLTTTTAVDDGIIPISINLERTTTPDQLAKDYVTTLETLKKMNPNIDFSAPIPANTKLNVPISTSF